MGQDGLCHHSFAVYTMTSLIKVPTIFGPRWQTSQFPSPYHPSIIRVSSFPHTKLEARRHSQWSWRMKNGSGRCPARRPSFLSSSSPCPPTAGSTSLVSKGPSSSTRQSTHFLQSPTDELSNLQGLLKTPAIADWQRFAQDQAHFPVSGSS